ncbi:response regulator [Paenibacillus riograndensis]|uniref:Two component AraC family transcriptional regulator n=1 Tax=Paenibacillus riograndensis SBR5 TaxID=1073571 RepID=A0A0E4H9Y8_9BACL|nr:response regulator [Paenibacillus riograndensis]CQR51525.1 two component AraC family transcriptional regulator [Paenibacillus riograndensis SBR5]
MTRNLLIVDDEENIRLGIRAMLEREYPGMYRYFFAEDGEEALQQLNQAAFDIMMTDIRMPVMDGITLIGRVQQLEHRPVVVIISGYDDFEYAKQAIRFGVRDYLLKPIVRSELRGTFSRLEQALKREQDINGMLSKATQREQDYRQNEMYYILMNIEIAGPELSERLDRAGLEDLQAGYVIGLIQEAEANGRTEGGGVLYSRIHEFLHTEALAEEYHFLDKEGRSLVVIRDEQRLGKLLEYLGQDRLLACQIGSSERMDKAEQFKTAYAQALKALRYFFLKSSTGLIRYSQIKDKPRNFEIPTEEIVKIGNMLGTGREQEMQALLSQVLDYRKMLLYDISYMEEISTAINELIFDKAFNVYGKEAVEIIKVYRQIGYLYNSPHFQDYYHGVENLLNRMNDFIKGIKSAHLNQREMKAALLFIEQNYNRSDFNLAMVSNHVSFNYSYFSSAFKEYMGMSFSQYIKKLRLVKAKELLENSAYKVYEVSAKVGFENPKHFNKVFREAEGISPLEYRMAAGLKQNPTLLVKLKEDIQE